MKNTNDDSTIKQLILSLNNFKDCEINLLKSGYNRKIYNLITPDGNKYIAKIGNELKDSNFNAINEITSQNFINHAGLNFVPKVIYHDFDNNFHIETSIGDCDIIFNELTNDMLDTFAKQLFAIHSLSIEKYYQYCLDNKFKKPETLSPHDSLNIFGFNRFEIVKDLCPDEYTVAWIETNLYESLITSSDIPLNEPHIRWGDIGENLRHDGPELYFIDWEFSELGYGNELEYIKIHSHLSPEKFDYLVSRYALHSGKSVKELLDEINRFEKITRVTDVVWAAMKWGQSETANDINKYKALTYKRMDLAENI